MAAPHFACFRSYARICATRATSARPAFVAESIARSYARIVASRRSGSPPVVACSLIASAVSTKYFAAVRWSPSVRKNAPAKSPSCVRASASIASTRSDIRRTSRSADMSLRSDLGPLTVSFPHAHMGRELDLLLESLRDELANVLDRRVLEKRVPVLVVVVGEDGAERFLDVREVEEHPAFVFALDEDVDLVCVPVEGPAPLVAREVMRAVDVLRDPELHFGGRRTGSP